MWYEEDLSDGEHLAVFMDLFKEIHETHEKDVISSKKEEMERIRKYLIAKLDAGLLGKNLKQRARARAFIARTEFGSWTQAMNLVKVLRILRRRSNP